MNVGFAPRIPQTVLPHQRTAATSASHLPNAVPEYNGIPSTQPLDVLPSPPAVTRGGVLVHNPVSPQSEHLTTTSSAGFDDDSGLDELCNWLQNPDCGIIVTPEMAEEIDRLLSGESSEEIGHVETQAVQSQDEIRYVPHSQPAAVLHSQIAVSSTSQCTDTDTSFVPPSPVVHDAAVSIQTGGPSHHSTHRDENSQGHPVPHQVPEAPREEPRSHPATESPPTSSEGLSEFWEQREARHFSLHTEQAKKEGGFIAYSMPDQTPIELPPGVSLPGKVPRLYNKKCEGWDLSGYNAQIAPQRAINVKKEPLQPAMTGKRRARSEDEGRDESKGPEKKRRRSNTPRGVTAEGDMAATAGTNQSLNPQDEP